jgi:transcriptional regulator with XRE-family HTH domain
MDRVPHQTYPNRIKEFRERVKRAEKVTQQKLADALGITQSGFNALEQGQTELTPAKALVLAPILKCKPWQLSPALEKFVEGYGDLKSYVTDLFNDPLFDEVFTHTLSLCKNKPIDPHIVIKIIKKSYVDARKEGKKGLKSKIAALVDYELSH